MAKKDRFEKVYSQRTVNVMEIWVDNEDILLQRASDMAKQEEIYLIVSLLVKTPYVDLKENKTVAFNPQGELISEYFKYGRSIGELCQKGDGILKSFDTEYGRIAPFICSDMAFLSNYEFVSLLLCIGMRIGEVAALLWSGIDYKQNVIHVTKTVTFNEDGIIDTGNPKSEAGKRDIPLNDTIKEVLSSQWKKFGNILPVNDNRIFVSAYGGVIYNYAINRAISGALARLEEQGRPIGYFTAHALRDTFATRYIGQGVRRL